MTLLLLWFVGCFGWYRSYFGPSCTACPSEWYQSDDCSRNDFYQCAKNGQGGKERACGFLGCNIHCCRDEHDLCGYQTGHFDAVEQNGPTYDLSDEACAEDCALKDYEGSGRVENKCYCWKGLGALDESKDYWRGCQFDLLPAYRTQERAKCPDDNGQILVEKQCKYFLPKDTSLFGTWSKTHSISTKPSGCYVEGGKRYWNTDGTGTYGTEDTHLICRGGKPLTVNRAGSAGQCPGGQQLTEFECQYQVVGYGTWAYPHDDAGATCGCYSNGNKRYFNRHTGDCTSWHSGEQMICKAIVPAELCQHIVDVTEETTDGDVPTTVEYLGQNIRVMWNVVHWDPTTECVTTAQNLITGPNKCSAQEACPVTFTEMKSHTETWGTSMGGSISGEAEFSFEVGIPLIFKIEGDLTVGAEYHLDFDHETTDTVENTKEQTLSCKDYDMMLNCYIFAKENVFNTTATASPGFYIVEEGQSQQTQVDCNKEFGINTVIQWVAKSGHGYEAREVPICEDTEGTCEQADNYNNCATDDFIREHCPESCGKFGLGPPSCPNGASCGFDPVPTNECPSPSDLDKEGSTFVNCLEVFNGPQTQCQATMPWPAGSGPGEWDIENCMDDNDPPNVYNIFLYHCDIEAEEEHNAQLQRYYAQLDESERSGSSMRGIEKPERPKRSDYNNNLRDAEVDKAFDVIEDEAVEFKKFSSRLHEVNKLLKETLQELKK